MNLRLRLALEWLLIGGIASILVVLAVSWRGIQDMDNIIYDQIASFGRPEADPDILIVAIDDPSLDSIGQWPWPRDIHAQLFEKLKQAKPNSIAFDVIISEESDSADDQALANAFAGNSNVFLPLHFVSPGSDGRAYDTEFPIKPLRDNATGIGHVNLSNSDEVIRRAVPCFDSEGSSGKWPHLMEMVFRTHSAGKPSKAFSQGACGSEVIVPYADRGSFATISYADLLYSNVPAQLIENRDVIIGATATGLRDNHPVPFANGGFMPGAEIMANMLSALKSDGFVKAVNDWMIVILSILPIWFLLFAFLQFSPKRALISSLAAILVIVVSSATALNYGIWFPPSAALAGVLIVYPLWGWRRLQAMSDFMDGELAELDEGGEIAPLLWHETRANDIVGRQSAALGAAIDHIRDLRRFVGDVLSDLPDPMAVVDQNGIIILTNDLVEQRFGRNVDGLNISEIADAIVAPAFRLAVKTFLDSTPGDLARPTENQNFIRFNTIDGSTYVMRRSPVTSNKNSHLGDIYYLADITTLAQAEEQREEVLQLLSHDMRAPQSAIIAALDGKIDKAARNRIESNARRTMRLAQDFVDMARMAETEFTGEDALLADLVRDVADGLWSLAEERQVKIRIDDQSDTAFVLAERDALSRAFANLLDNAVKFSPEGSKIEVNVSKLNIDRMPYVAVTIRDNGPGISDDMLSRLFTKFATDDAQKRRAQGTGLGLTYVEKVAIRHGGTIRGGNRKEGGAEFVLILPESLGDAE